MKLLYLREHLCCSNYQMNSDTGFSCHQLDKDDVYQIDNSKSSCAPFMIQGQVNLDLGEFYEGEMEQGQMLYIPQSIKAQIESITGSRCILLFWDKHISTCDKLFLSSLSIKENDTDTNDVILPIKKPLMNVLESVNLYLNARLLCRHMHLLKQQELLLVLRGFYTKKELAAFFSASTNIRESFERFVLDNYRKADSVKELADLYHISERSFNRKFHSCFGESPYQWIQKKKARHIQEMINNPELSFKEIAGYFDFSTSSHFTAYCQRMFGMSPSELRKKNRDKWIKK
ncbi:helix-turn-helix domain-containing protein [Parabacteroides distasonis]|uniref:helix-turn-helix domain-containing protein n=1 Tax=Parabacteroides distasonis TaxID=823 RepID=UPI0021641DA3|nr:helix-turn-helix domain-containing protein [Parabacteroides distasonis]UVR96335.1 helix-turn-helix domain-containing protein [Parabacteroides distasonis]